MRHGPLIVDSTVNSSRSSTSVIGTVLGFCGSCVGSISWSGKRMFVFDRKNSARVIATDLIADRCELAARYSADRVVDGSSQNGSGGSLEDAVREERPDGADVVIDTTGISGMYERCRDLIRREGKIMMQGYYPDPISIEFHPTHLTRASVTFPCGWDDEENDEIADEMRTGMLRIDPLITHRIPFREAPDAYELVVEHPEASLGMVFDWTGA